MARHELRQYDGVSGTYRHPAVRLGCSRVVSREHPHGRRAHINDRDTPLPADHAGRARPDRFHGGRPQRAALPDACGRSHEHLYGRIHGHLNARCRRAHERSGATLLGADAQRSRSPVASFAGADADRSLLPLRTALDGRRVLRPVRPHDPAVRCCAASRCGNRSGSAAQRRAPPAARGRVLPSSPGVVSPGRTTRPADPNALRHSMWPHRSARSRSGATAIHQTLSGALT